MAKLQPRQLIALGVLLIAAAAIPVLAATQDRSTNVDIAKTVVRMPLAKGVSIDDAITSMKLRANLLNFKLVSHQPLSEQLKAEGVKNVRRLEIYQFCNPVTAYDMVKFDMAYAAYLPCRIAVVEGRDGKGWLVMLDPRRLLTKDMPSALRAKAEKVVHNLQEIMKAGANGAL
jgi:uncharacterized protein (DUF302 family)